MQPIIVPDPVTGDNYKAADYLTFQARAFGMRHGSGSTLSASAAGIDGVAWVKTAGVANGTLALIDDNHDWRDRVIHGYVTDLAAAANQPQGATYHNNWPGPTVFSGYTGLGALSNAGTGAAVSNGNPPVWATGGGGTSTAVTTTISVYLYADPTTGALYVYNATVNPLFLYFRISATADLGLR